MPARTQIQLFATLLLILLAIPKAQGADITGETVIKYLLFTVHAFRTVYDNTVLPHIAQAGIEPKEHWVEDPHGVMLPFQFVKLGAAMIKDFDIGIISLTPIYASNFPKTENEVQALKSLAENPKRSMVTFSDAGELKGLMADLAIEQSCADCHNRHPKSVRHDFKKGDLMGAIVVRLKD